jgi:hypothetical protein
MKRSDNILEGSNHQKWLFISFFTSKFQSFFASKMNVEESLVEKLQRQSIEKLHKLKEEQGD